MKKRSRLRNEFLRSKSKDDKKNYVKQKNVCVSLLEIPKKEYYRNLKSCGKKNIFENS